MITKNTQLYTTRDAAKKLCISPQTLEKWRTQGRGPRLVRLENKLVRYRELDLDAFVNGGEHDY